MQPQTTVTNILLVNWSDTTSWLFTSMVEDVNWGRRQASFEKCSLKPGLCYSKEIKETHLSESYTFHSY